MFTNQLIAMEFPIRTKLFYNNNNNNNNTNVNNNNSNNNTNVNNKNNGRVFVTLV